MLLLTSLDQSSQNSSASNPSTNSTTKPIRSSNVELPLSILNAASLSNSVGSIGLHINPFLASKNSSGISPTGFFSSNSTSNSNNITPAPANADEELDDDADHVNSAKNAKLLENYKAIKASQMIKEKERSAKLNSPNQASSNRTLDTSNDTILNNSISVSLPSIVVASESNNIEEATVNAAELNRNLLESGGGNYDESDDNEDTDDEEVEGDQVEFDTGSFVNSEDEYENTICSFNENNDDTQSQMTEMTGFNNDKSPASVKKLDKTSLSERQKSLKKEKPKSGKLGINVNSLFIYAPEI